MDSQMDQRTVMRQLRVAAYCRVSTEEEEQQSSYEAQCTYYTDKIMTNPEWIMAGIFADEGISGTSTKNRDDFNRMIRRCRQKKIDLILKVHFPVREKYAGQPEIHSCIERYGNRHHL